MFRNGWSVHNIPSPDNPRKHPEDAPSPEAVPHGCNPFPAHTQPGALPVPGNCKIRCLPLDHHLHPPPAVSGSRSLNVPRKWTSAYPCPGFSPGFPSRSCPTSHIHSHPTQRKRYWAASLYRFHKDQPLTSHHRCGSLLHIYRWFPYQVPE